MANTNFLQATIELFGAVITVVVAMVLVIITGNRKKSEKSLFATLIASGFSLVVDAGWYIFDGNTTQAGIIANWICNLSIFICNPVMVILVKRYICNMLNENGHEPNKVLSNTSRILATIALMMPVSNMFYKWMYYFDSKNIYHRMNGWYIYTVVNSLAITACVLLIVVHRSKLSRNRRYAIYAFFLAPFIGIAIQTVQMGISFIQIGNALGCVVIVSSYLIEWIKTENKGSQVSEDRKKMWIIECAFSIMILFISAAIISCVISVNNVSNENSQQNSVALAYMVSETVEGTLSEPINVSKTMAQSEIIIEALSNGNIENTETEEKMLSFMKRIKEKYGYQMIFVASEKTKAYYTYEGLSRYMDISEDSVDAWYLDYINKGKEYELNIDADKDNNMSLAVFVNMEVRDNDGNFLGVCGVGTSIESLMDILSDYENKFHLNISLVDDNGLIEVSTDRSKIENDTYDMSEIEGWDRSEIYYERTPLKSVLAKNMGNYEWNLVIEDNVPDKLNIFRIILPSMIIYVIGVVFMLGFSLIFGVHERHRSMALQESQQESETAKAESYAKGRFLANMSHEIRTPINAVLGMDTMILRESKEPKIKEYAMIIQNSGNILLSLINDILDISKIESGKMEIVPEKYNFSILIADVMNMIGVKAKDKNLEVKLDVNNNLPSGLLGDEVRIKQIIVNLMNNAIKYTEKGSVTLKVDGEVSDDTAKLFIAVRDTGIGIKEENIQKLFDDFVRVDESRNKHIEGTGLGLSIVERLLELMDSKLNVSSVYGEGSEFSFVIDQKITDSAPIGDIAMHLQKKAENYEYKSLFIAPDARVLVVDDNDVNRIVFTSLLKESRIQIDEAECGQKALDLVFNKTYDIIFLDHMMPDMDGIEVLKRIKGNSNHSNIDTPIIVLTANAIAGVREEYLQEGFNDYLSKPIIPEQLEKMIASLLPAEKMAVGEKSDVRESEETELPITEGVDWNYAKLHLSDNNILLKTLQNFVESIDYEADNLSEIYRDLMAEEDSQEKLDLYRIKVHSMKSTSTLLGCVPIAGIAATLESAAKSGRMDLIKDITPYFIDIWRMYRDRLAFAVKPQGDKKEIEDITLITDYLSQLNEAAKAFDVDGADSVVEKLNEYKYDLNIQEIINRITICVSNLNMEEVSELCMELLNKM